jgi:hypothetical protein
MFCFLVNFNTAANFGGKTCSSLFCGFRSSHTNVGGIPPSTVTIILLQSTRQSEKTVKKGERKLKKYPCHTRHRLVVAKFLLVLTVLNFPFKLVFGNMKYISETQLCVCRNWGGGGDVGEEWAGVCHCPLYAARVLLTVSKLRL